MPIHSGKAALQEKLQKTANELRQIQDLLSEDNEIDARLLEDFRDAVNKVRALAWAVEGARKAKTQDVTRKILVADDSQFQLQLLKKYLSEKGLAVMIAADGFQAWTTALREEPDLIVLDLNMPAGSGLDILKRLKTSVKTAAIPVIGITASTEASAEHAMTELGAVAFLTKPLDLDRLHLVISEILSKM